MYNNINKVKENLRELISLNFWYDSKDLIIINNSVDIIENYFYSEEFRNNFYIIIKFPKFFNKKEIYFIRDLGIFFDGFDMFEEDPEDFWEDFY